MVDCFQTAMYHLTSTPIAASVAYLLVMCSLRDKMKSEEPIKIARSLIAIYNVIQVIHRSVSLHFG